MLDLGFNVIFKGNNFIRLLKGMGITLEISLYSVLLSILFGLLLGIVWKNGNTAIKLILRVYLETMRTLPQLVMLFVIHFGFVRAVGLNLSAKLTAVIAFTLWGSAEMSDLVKGSFDSISPHQGESAFSLGLSKAQVYMFVILPQAVRRLIPVSINLVTRMIKTTSLVLMIGIVEVIKVAQQIIEANRMSSPNASFGVYLIVFALYFTICYVISFIAKVFEKRSI